MLRHIIGSSGALLSAAAVVAKEPEKTEPKKESEKLRPSNLPLYTPLHEINNPPKPHHEKQPNKVEQTIESGVSVVRSQITDAYGLVASQAKVVEDFFSTGKEHSRFIIDYLNEPSNGIQRGGAIALGGLSGLIIGIRRGIIRRIIYMSIGAGVVASVCYPEEAGVYAQHGLVEAKKYATIAYNFACGVKPGDDAKELPKIPTNMDELGESVSTLFTITKKKIFPDKKEK